MFRAMGLKRFILGTLLICGGVAHGAPPAQEPVTVTFLQGYDPDIPEGSDMIDECLRGVFPPLRNDAGIFGVLTP